MVKFRKIISRKFVAYWWFTGWNNINFGVSLDWRSPNIEIHLPFGFIRIGWEATEEAFTWEEYKKYIKSRQFGYEEK